MSLSKPLYDLLTKYFEQLFNNPVRTKAITCCVIAATGNLASQYISGAKVLNLHSTAVYGIYGLLFGGTSSHYFYSWLETAIPSTSSFYLIKRLIIERFIFSPLNIAFTLYVLARLEGKSHDVAIKQFEALYWTVLSSSWKYITLIQYINFAYVPPMLRVLVINLVGFFWTIYIANKRRQQQKRARKL